MPMIRRLYPPDWTAISAAIRERAGNACERCGVANHAVGARDQRGDWHNEAEIDGMNSDVGMSLFGADSFPRIIRIVLTTAHVGAPFPDGRPGDKHDKMDCRPENLLSLCQLHHLEIDREDHMRRAAWTRQRKKIDAGQQKLPGMGW